MCHGQWNQSSGQKKVLNFGKSFRWSPYPKKVQVGFLLPQIVCEFCRLLKILKILFLNKN